MIKMSQKKKQHFFTDYTKTTKTDKNYFMIDKLSFGQFKWIGNY